MSSERIEGKENKEHGKAEEKIGKEFGDKERELAGKEQKESGKTEEKIGKEKEKQGFASASGAYMCAACGASFGSADERERHNSLVHRTI
ncbi:MAG: hypothetical protein ACHQ1H_07625 [Nitrososphaerales archaeon]